MRLFALVDKFLSGLAHLYGPQVITINFHQLVHLPTFIRRYGPTWNYSLFVFESDNGVLQRLLTGTVGQAKQAAERFMMHSTLPRIARTLPAESAAWLQEMCPRQTAFAQHEDERKIKGVGTCKAVEALPMVAPDEMLNCGEAHGEEVVEYERVGYGPHIFWTGVYRWATARRKCDCARLRRPQHRGVGASDFIQILRCFYCTVCKKVFLSVLLMTPTSAHQHGTLPEHIVECKVSNE